MNRRENYIRAVNFDYPERIPVSFVINPSSYFAYNQDFLFGEMEKHNYLFPNFKKPNGKFVPELSDICKKGAFYYDGFGCRWESPMDGLLGTVVEHPLQDLTKVNIFPFPNPKIHNGIVPVDWEKEEARISKMKKDGLLTVAGLRHGHTFLQMCDIRGYENFLFDMMDNEPYLRPFMQRLTDFNLEIIDRYVNMNVDVIEIPEDLGMQQGPMLSVDNFNEYVLPCYRQLIKKAKSNGAIVHMHSDGDIKLLADGLITDGVDVLNLQDLANGIDWIKDNLKGKVCIDLDVDRQRVVQFGTPKQVDELIRFEVESLSSKAGGLMMIFGLYPGLPEENIVALMDALEKYSIL